MMKGNNARQYSLCGRTERVCNNNDQNSSFSRLTLLKMSTKESFTIITLKMEEKVSNGTHSYYRLKERKRCMISYFAHISGRSPIKIKFYPQFSKRVNAMLLPHVFHFPLQLVSTMQPKIF